MNRRTFLHSGIALLILSKLLPLSSAKTTPTTPTQSKSLDLSLLLQCIAEVESGNRDDLVGPCGARSKYQITERVWYQHSQLNFHKYCSADHADAVAREHMNWLVKHLKTPITPFWLAYAWHRGLASADQYFHSSHNVNLRAIDYANRVANLYHARRTQ